MATDKDEFHTIRCLSAGLRLHASLGAADLPAKKYLSKQQERVWFPAGLFITSRLEFVLVVRSTSLGATDLRPGSKNAYDFLQVYSYRPGEPGEPN